MMIGEEECSNSSAQLVHCNTTTKYLNVYTETVKCLSAFLPPLLRGMININCLPDKQKELIAETVCSEPKSRMR